jgi:hypothetical protein
MIFFTYIKFILFLVNLQVHSHKQHKISEFLYSSTYILDMLFQQRFLEAEFLQEYKKEKEQEKVTWYPLYQCLHCDLDLLLESLSEERDGVHRDLFHCSCN